MDRESLVTSAILLKVLLCQARQGHFTVCAILMLLLIMFYFGGLMPMPHLHVKACPVRATEDKFQELSGTWLCPGCYRVYIPLLFMKIALRGSYGTDLCEGVTTA